MNLDIGLQQNTSLAADFLERPGSLQASANPGSPKACPALWTLGFMDPRVSQEHMLAMTSLPSVEAAQPRAPPLFLRKMDHSPDQGESLAPASDDRWQDSGEFRLQVDFFRKLGYSTKEVQAILLKLGPGADTNTVLGELVRSGAGTAAEREAATAESQGPSIVPRGGGSTKAPCIQSAALSTPQEVERDAVNVLKPIVIDGSNVAMSHGNKVVFSCLGLQLAVNYFLGRGHKDITVFVPSWRKEQPRPDVPITDQQILRDLERKKILVFTPSRRVGGKRVVCYDDRFIVKLAHETDGIIVSNDTYRDLQNERPEWKRCIEEQLLMYSFVNDKFMPPDDPLGRYGPSLDNFLRKKPQVPEQKRQPCPYEKKCTYGIKCKFFHPERANQSQRSLADELRENAKLSALKDDRRHTSPKKHSHSPASMSMEEELEQLSLDSQHCARKGQVSENMPFYWTGAYWTGSKKPSPSSHPERPSHQLPTSIDSSVHCGSQECLDSGLGSYESQYSEASWGPYGAKVRASPCSSRPSYPPHGDPDRLEGYRSCDCCSLQQYGHNPANRFVTSCQPCYPAYGDHPYPSAVQHYSLPRNFPHQEKYWVLPNRSSSSLPAEQCQMPGLRARGSTETYGDQWAQPQRAALGGEREEVRKKLQAIFNPYHVEQVMEMFPHMLDPQKLAAEILSLKSQGRI